MKIILSLLLFPTLIFGQITNHFENVNSKWYVAKTFPSANMQNPNFVATTTTVFGFHGDSLYNGETWYKLYSTQDSLFISSLIYQGLIRAENNRILFIDSLNQLDTLYNFNLVIGDSVLFNLDGQFPEKIPVIDIDSIQINGQFYRRFKFAEPLMNAFSELNEVWIEGIGSIHGPIFPNTPRQFAQEIPDSLILICTYSNSQQYWQHLSFNSCYLNIVLGSDRITETDLKIYPNPFQDNVKIKLTRADNYEINIFNSSGQKLIQKIITSDILAIDLTTLIDGIYFITVDSNSSRWTSKLLKKHSL
jgi:hypothetical protein